MESQQPTTQQSADILLPTSSVDPVTPTTQDVLFLSTGPHLSTYKVEEYITRPGEQGEWIKDPYSPYLVDREHVIEMMKEEGCKEEEDDFFNRTFRICSSRPGVIATYHDVKACNALTAVHKYIYTMHCADMRLKRMREVKKMYIDHQGFWMCSTCKMLSGDNTEACPTCLLTIAGKQLRKMCNNLNEKINVLAKATPPGSPICIPETQPETPLAPSNWWHCPCGVSYSNDVAICLSCRRDKPEPSGPANIFDTRKRKASTLSQLTPADMRQYDQHIVDLQERYADEANRLPSVRCGGLLCDKIFLSSTLVSEETVSPVSAFATPTGTLFFCSDSCMASRICTRSKILGGTLEQCYTPLSPKGNYIYQRLMQAEHDWKHHAIPHKLGFESRQKEPLHASKKPRMD